MFYFFLLSASRLNYLFSKIGTLICWVDWINEWSRNWSVEEWKPTPPNHRCWKPRMEESRAFFYCKRGGSGTPWGGKLVSESVTSHTHHSEWALPLGGYSDPHASSTCLGPWGPKSAQNFTSPGSDPQASRWRLCSWSLSPTAVELCVPVCFVSWSFFR